MLNGNIGFVLRCTIYLTTVRQLVEDEAPITNIPYILRHVLFFALTLSETYISVLPSFYGNYGWYTGLSGVVMQWTLHM